MPILAVVLAGAGFVVCTASCSGRSDSAVAADAAVDSGTPLDRAMILGVWPANATKMVAEDHGGGYVQPAPAGSACPYEFMGTFTLTMVDKQLVWHVCQEMVAKAPYQFVDGTRTLTDAELAPLVAALRAVSISTQSTCGEDKQNLSLTVTTPTGDSQYLDGFYSCLRQGVYIDDIDGVFGIVRVLAR